MKKLLNLLLITLIFPALICAQNNSEEKLHTSIRNGELETVKKIIEKDNTIINSPNHLGSTPLMVAASLDKMDISNYLIDQNAELNTANVHGSTTIHYAALNGQLDLVKQLVDKGAKVDVWNNRGRNPLHYSAISGNIELFEYLESKDLDMTPATSDQSSMLHWACNGGNVDMVKYMLNRDFSLDLLDSDGYSVLHWAAIGNTVDVVKFLVEEKGMDVRLVNETGNTVLHFAAYGKNTEAMKYLLSNGYDVNEKFDNGQTTLHLACRVGDVEFVKYLIDKGVDVNAVDNGGRTALDNAAFDGQVDVVEALMDNGAKIAPNICKESACSESTTALHSAAWRAPLVVEYFIKKGVDINIHDEDHRTALHEAMESDSVRSVKLLCDAKININQQDKDGTTALHKGVNSENVEGIKVLFKYNPEINLSDISGYTPLHYAAIKGNEDIIELLLENGAKLDAKDNKGNSALDLAMYYGNKGAAKTLKAKEAKSFKKYKNLFAKELAEGESAIWYLDHSGYAVKTKNNLLIFDYWEREPITSNGNIKNGYIDPEEIKDLNVTVFVSHTHGDHFSKVIFDWNDRIDNISYVLGFDYDTEVEYNFIPARETKVIDGIKITPVTSNDSGQGFYVEVDGVTIFHPGDHTNISRDMCPNYTGDVKFLADKYKHTDIAFFPVTGCRFQDKVALNMGTDFAIETMKPVLALPMHGSNGYTYKSIAEKFNKEHKQEVFKYPVNRGDRFFYKKTDSSIAKAQ